MKIEQAKGLVQASEPSGLDTMSYFPHVIQRNHLCGRLPKEGFNPIIYALREYRDFSYISNDSDTSLQDTYWGESVMGDK
jgi:hypothetical protein